MLRLSLSLYYNQIMVNQIVVNQIITKVISIGNTLEDVIIDRQ